MRQLLFLIVDDLFINQIFFGSMLELMGYEYRTADNGKEAIKLLKEEDFDLIFMDFEMPVMNGIETTNYIRNKMEAPKKNVPIVGLSSHNQSDVEKKIKDVEFSDFLYKPFTEVKLKLIIDKQLSTTHKML